MSEVVLVNPNGRLEVAQGLCRAIAERTREVLAAADAVTVTEDNWNDPQTRDAIEELGEMVEDLRERGKKLVADVCAATEAQRVITAIDSRLWSFKAKADPLCAYARLKAKLDGLKEQVKAFKEAATPKAPQRTWVIALLADDKQFDAMAKAATKCGASVERFATPQSDKAVKAIQKWFEENV